MKNTLLFSFLMLVLGLRTQAATFSTNFTVSGGLVPDGRMVGFVNRQTISGIVGNITNVTVRLLVTNGYNGDLYGYVVGPDGGFTTLVNRVGKGSGDPAQTEYGFADPGFNVTFTDGAGNPNIHTTNGGGSIIVTGAYHTEDNTLNSSFAGQTGNGLWTLFIADLSGGEQSTLVGWGLDIFYQSISPSSSNTLSGTLALQSFAGTNRLVRFVCSEVNGGTTNYLQTNDVTLTNFSGGTAGYTLTVPTNTTHISAKTAWNLRKRQAVPTFVAGAATVSFTGTNILKGGDLVTQLGGTINNTDNTVDSSDYLLLLGKYLLTVGSDADVGRADADGNGVVDSSDYLLLLGNYLTSGDAP